MPLWTWLVPGLSFGLLLIAAAAAVGISSGHGVESVGEQDALVAAHENKRTVSITGARSDPGGILARVRESCRAAGKHAAARSWDPVVSGLEQFRRMLRDAGTTVIRLRPMSPNLNAYAERFVRSIIDECLDQMIFVGQATLRRAVAEYMEHYHAERNYQRLGNQL